MLRGNNKWDVGFNSFGVGSEWTGSRGCPWVDRIELFALRCVPAQLHRTAHAPNSLMGHIRPADYLSITSLGEAKD